jgi:hypothetical protein
MKPETSRKSAFGVVEAISEYLKDRSLSRR